MIWLPIILGGLVVLALVSDDPEAANNMDELSEDQLIELKRQRNQILKRIKKHKKSQSSEVPNPKKGSQD